MIQHVFCWEGPRLLCLWDLDSRNSFTSQSFISVGRLQAHLSGIIRAFRIEGYDVDITPVRVVNPNDDHEKWVIDWNPSDPNARVFTLT